MQEIQEGGVQKNRTLFFCVVGLNVLGMIYLANSKQETRSVSLRALRQLQLDSNETDTLGELDEEDDEDALLELLQYVSIPIVSAIVGYATNWLALKMTFYPTYFLGYEVLGKYSRIPGQPFGCIGWQGIIPTKVEKIAGKSVDLLTDKVFDVKEVFQRIKLEEAAEHMKIGFKDAIGDIVDELSDEYIISEQTEWKRMKNSIKTQITNYSLSQLPGFTEGFMGDLLEKLDDVYDLRDMCVTEMGKDKQLLNDIFEQVGRKELVFIRMSGLYFGFLFGCVQLSLWYFFPEPWILPVFGFLNGTATNYLALYIIFAPIDPIIISIPTCMSFLCCGKKEIKLQGLFLQRQDVASLQFARKIVGTVIHSENIWKHMLTGPKSDKFIALLDQHVDDLTDSLVGMARPLVILYLGEENFQKMKKTVREMSRNQIQRIIEHMHVYTDEALDLEKEISEKMAALPSKDFEQVLHPAFEEDEVKLIAVGGLLGTLVGLFQLYAVFGGT